MNWAEKGDETSEDRVVSYSVTCLYQIVRQRDFPHMNKWAEPIIRCGGLSDLLKPFLNEWCASKYAPSAHYLQLMAAGEYACEYFRVLFVDLMFG